MSDGASSEKNMQFVESAGTPTPLPAQPKAGAKRGADRSLLELLGVCRGIIADGVVTTEEVVYLSKWLEQAGVMTEWPGTEIAGTVERILSDGIVTEAEQKELLVLLRRVDAHFKAVGTAEPKGKAQGRASGRSAESSASEDSLTARVGIEIRLACGCGQRVAVASAVGEQEFGLKTVVEANTARLASGPDTRCGVSFS